MKKLLAFLLCAVLVVGLLAGCSGDKQSKTESKDDTTITAVQLSEKDLKLTVGGTATLEVTVEPSTAPKSNLTWTSDNDKVATVTDGIVKGVGAGTAIVTVKTENGVTASCNVTVSAIIVKSISLDKTDETVNEGTTFYITATIDPSDASDDELSWYSSDNKVAVVSGSGNSGKVTAVKAGTTKICCRASNGVEAICNLTVNGSAEDEEKDEDDDEKADDKDNDDDNDDDDSAQVPDRYRYLDRDPGGHLNPGYRPYEADFVFPYSSVRKLTDAEVTATLNSMAGSPVSSSFAQDAINEIYARNGYVFKASNLSSYYSSKPWYYADSNFTIDKLNAIEKYNIDFLKKYT